MRNITSIDITKNPYELGYVNEGNTNNGILLNIIIGSLTNPYIEITKQDGSIKNTSTLAINNSIIQYELPISYIYASGTLKVRIKADGYSSEYISFNISNTLNSSDDIIVKIENESYIIKKVFNYKYHDLPMDDIIKAIYPIGSIYINFTNINPSILFGGTWKQLKGRFLIGQGACEANTTDYFGKCEAGYIDMLEGELGGEVMHTLTTNEMPSHNHGIQKGSGNFISDNANVTPGTVMNFAAGTYKRYAMSTTGTTGENEAHNNMPPYIVVYMWQRTA